ncbi:MAG: Ig-like domain-containing protein [Saprospiraceae bacterium]
MQHQIHPINVRQGSPFLAFFVYQLLFILLLSSCARQGAPTGGPKDIKPPGIDTMASTPNFSTRFDRKRIELKFDEWVVLSDVASQIVVSPPLAKRPEVVLKGKTVVVNFDKSEIFRPNTTYTINFGTAVKDLHEKNPAKDLRFVFSTGDFIDSLFFSGVLVDAFSGEPVENASVLLYENPADSAVRKERPYYFSRTNKAGQYEFKNLRSSAYRLVAIEDADQNLKWDGENEHIAFRDSALLVQDSMKGPVNLKLFKNQPKFRLSGQNLNRYGLAKLGFNTALNNYAIQTIAPKELIVWAEKTPDSLMLWYDLPTQDTAWTLLFSRGKIPGQDSSSQSSPSEWDTIQVKKLSRLEFLENHHIAFGDIPLPSAPSAARGKSKGGTPKPQPAKTMVQAFALPAVLPFNFPVAAFDTSRWMLMLDSNRISDFNVEPDSASPRRISLSVQWKQGKTYMLMLLPGALTDFWGKSNTDTLVRHFNVLAEKQLGTLTLTVEKIQPGTSYVVQLLNGTAFQEEKFFVAETNTQKLIFKHLPVAAYTARLLEDTNRNGRWDTGDFDAHRQPERVFIKKLDALRANWELELTFSTESVNDRKKKQ